MDKGGSFWWLFFDICLFFDILGFWFELRYERVLWRGGWVTSIVCLRLSMCGIRVRVAQMSITPAGLELRSVLSIGVA